MRLYGIIRDTLIKHHKIADSDSTKKVVMKEIETNLREYASGLSSLLMLIFSSHGIDEALFNSNAENYESLTSHMITIQEVLDK